jgi:hypothetical protein
MLKYLPMALGFGVVTRYFYGNSFESSYLCHTSGSGLNWDRNSIVPSSPPCDRSGGRQIVINPQYKLFYKTKIINNIPPREMCCCHCCILRFPWSLVLLVRCNYRRFRRDVYRLSTQQVQEVIYMQRNNNMTSYYIIMSHDGWKIPTCIVSMDVMHWRSNH